MKRLLAKCEYISRRHYQWYQGHLRNANTVNTPNTRHAVLDGHYGICMVT
jgi:hypothetical protein